MAGLFDVLMSKELGQNEPPVNMSSNPLSGLLSLLQGSPKDVELPNESGMIDPRIPNVGGQLLKAFKTANAIAAGQGDAVSNLQNAGLKGLGK